MRTIARLLIGVSVDRAMYRSVGQCLKVRNSHSRWVRIINYLNSGKDLYFFISIFSSLLQSVGYYIHVFLFYWFTGLLLLLLLDAVSQHMLVLSCSSSGCCCFLLLFVVDWMWWVDATMTASLLYSIVQWHRSLFMRNHLQSLSLSIEHRNKKDFIIVVFVTFSRFVHHTYVLFQFQWEYKW